jgi:hypothetical protein
MIAGGAGAMALAGAFGLSLASYAESDSFAFYKQRYRASHGSAQPAIDGTATYPASAPFVQAAAPFSAPVASRAEYAAAEPDYPEDVLGPARRVGLEWVEPADLDARVIPEMRGFWTRPIATEQAETQARPDDEAPVGAADGQEDMEEPLGVEG